MSKFEQSFQGIQACELNNNNINPELQKFLDDKVISSEEAQVLLQIDKNNKWGGINITQGNLDKLRASLSSSLSTGSLSITDINKLRGIVDNSTPKQEKEEAEINDKIALFKSTINSSSNIVGISSDLYFAVVKRESNFQGNNLTHVTKVTFRDMKKRKELYLPLLQKIAANGSKLNLSIEDINAFKVGDIKYLQSRNYKDNNINIILGTVVFKAKEKVYKELNKNKIVNLSIPRLNRLTRVGRNVDRNELKKIYTKIENNNYLKKNYHTLVNYNGNNKSFKGENYPHKYFYAIANLLDACMV